MAFATVDDLEEAWRSLSTEERQWAGMLIGAASAWIEKRAPWVDEDDESAKFVVLDVVRNAMAPGAQKGFASFSKSIGPWSKSGTLVNPQGALTFTAWHRELLGLPSVTGPRWYFGDC